jgi:UDP-N-acetylmuramoyl-tripeptide--D-alanyl-D-alanine ligase
MTPIDVMEIARLVNGEAHGIAPETQVRGVQTDSRAIRPGDLFVCLPGEHADGHDFAAAAVDAGAAAVLASKALLDRIPHVVCVDTQWALGRIAAMVASRRSTRVLAITGSNGKNIGQDSPAGHSVARCIELCQSWQSEQ